MHEVKISSCDPPNLIPTIYKPFCLKDHILLTKIKFVPGNITFLTEIAILTFAEIA